ncbi:hypothetical protein DOTSEDRAFT_38548 [Dothistroma septosporum NZE10]|uniref:Uncharacterized protein n=1 Tax=Dothistroma septosporum (strain NZE10 / CBS 128990) TaxID=675120 RepID=M2YKF6_DOTSN|nr:hypothetical protein DOTSEDRAFT_38548 [Dothistroma septosporum NZE10]
MRCASYNVRRHNSHFPLDFLHTHLTQRVTSIATQHHLAMDSPMSPSHPWPVDTGSANCARYNTAEEPTIKPEILSTPTKNTDSNDSLYYRSETPTRPTKKLRGGKGRSLGDLSSKPIKELRAQAENGSIDAAMKLGWGVDRLTELYNRKKAERGIEVYEGQDIDDEELLARIAQRNRLAKEAQRRRSDKLKIKAYAGDLDAAKKLGFSKRRIAELCPEVYSGDVVEPEQSKKEIQAAIKLGFSNEKMQQLFPHHRESSASSGGFRSATPASHHDFSRERSFPLHGNTQHHFNGGWNFWQPQANVFGPKGPPTYPVPAADFGLEMMLQHELSQARQDIMIATTRFNAAEQQLDRLRTLEANSVGEQSPRAGQSHASVRNRIVRMKYQDGPAKVETNSGGESVDSAIEVD